MKVAIATDDYVNVTGHVGRCEGFLVVTVENGEVKETEKRENNFTNHGSGGHQERGQRHQHGVEHKNGHERLADGLKDCSHLICHGVGWRLVEDLIESGIKPIITNEVDAVTAAKKFEQGTLEILDDAECRAY